VAVASRLGTRPVLSTREVASVEYTTHLVSSPGFFRHAARPRAVVASALWQHRTASPPPVRPTTPAYRRAVAGPGAPSRDGSAGDQPGGREYFPGHRCGCTSGDPDGGSMAPRRPSIRVGPVTVPSTSYRIRPGRPARPSKRPPFERTVPSQHHPAAQRRLSVRLGLPHRGHGDRVS
jgi:hypothetical protein